eukprot:CAMPEP_0205939618 /NCGR_PEP_ID=MMETSP1325-20131115/50154_1 /ASSEMBLY_ACC=CAM_ASM_000708 /TAXON_ID=236786 /ORGANISM="Florenciella sp., Strain RCC1007" /LENGTH=100 /DNA_ID=CAMNT_0053310101 /DNA_START=27 /DNA_END=330 /DNA_ORIENTATION=+
MQVGHPKDRRARCTRRRKVGGDMGGSCGGSARVSMGSALSLTVMVGASDRTEEGKGVRVGVLSAVSTVHGATNGAGQCPSSPAHVCLHQDRNCKGDALGM